MQSAIKIFFTDLDEKVQLILFHFSLILLQFNGDLEWKQQFMLLKDAWQAINIIYQTLSLLSHSFLYFPTSHSSPLSLFPVILVTSSVFRDSSKHPSVFFCQGYILSTSFVSPVQP